MGLERVNYALPDSGFERGGSKDALRKKEIPAW